MQSYVPFSMDRSLAALDAAKRTADALKVRGTGRRPMPPRDIQVQSGSRKVLVTWKLPTRNDDIAGWRVYKDTEDNLAADIDDKGVRQVVIEVTAGAVPPVTNIFVSSRNPLGIESQKVQAQGKASVEAAAPADPGPPPGYTKEASGGADRRYSSFITRRLAT